MKQITDFVERCLNISNSQADPCPNHHKAGLTEIGIGAFTLMQQLTPLAPFTNMV